MLYILYVVRVRLRLPNGCELSGRGSHPHILVQELSPRSSLACDAESPVRSSELLSATAIIEHWIDAKLSVSG